MHRCLLYETQFELQQRITSTSRNQAPCPIYMFVKTHNMGFAIKTTFLFKTIYRRVNKSREKSWHTWEN